MTTAPTVKTDHADTEDTLASRLTEARKRAGMTAQAAAFAVGVNPGTWRNWERGDHTAAAARLGGLACIAEKLGVDRNWLEHGTT